MTIEIIKELSEYLRIIISYLNQVMQPLKTKQTYNTHEQQQKRCPTAHSTVEYSDSIVGPRREHGKSYIHIQDNGAHMWRGRNSTGSLDCYGSRLWPGVRKGYTDFDHEPMSPFPVTCTVECHGPVGNPGLPSSSQHHQLQSATHTEGTFIHCREDQLGNLVIR